MAEGNKPYAAELKKPPPHTSRRHRQQRRDYVTGDHLFSLVFKTGARFRLQLWRSLPC
jgi:hypothetical protein